MWRFSLMSVKLYVKRWKFTGQRELFMVSEVLSESAREKIKINGILKVLLRKEVSCVWLDTRLSPESKWTLVITCGWQVNRPELFMLRQMKVPRPFESINTYSSLSAASDSFPSILKKFNCIVSPWGRKANNIIQCNEFCTKYRWSCGTAV